MFSLRKQLLKKQKYYTGLPNIIDMKQRGTLEIPVNPSLNFGMIMICFGAWGDTSIKASTWYKRNLNMQITKQNLNQFGQNDLW